MYKYFEKLLEIRNVRAADVAKATGLPKSMFSEWKNGRSNPKVDKLLLIADYFGVSIDYLVTGRMPEFRDNEELGELALCLVEREKISKLLNVARDCSDEDIEIALNLLEMLKKRAY